MAPSEMRGLTQYIADLRACRVRELEEKRINKEMAHIRQKFKDGNLNGYEKKKYLSKIVFTYILGYPVDVGHMEAVNLISSPVFSEKQIGYLALTLLMDENSDIVRLVVNSIRKDLDDMNEVNNCLALHAIANIGGREMAESLAEDVHRLLISPTSRGFVKKKAALTLLRLYRKHPDVIPAGEWALRIVSLMDDADYGVALSVTSLVLTLAQDHLDAFAVCYSKAVDRLHKIAVDLETPLEYIYYKVPIPWLQCKLLRLLQYYPATETPSVLLTLQTALKTIMQNSQDTPKNVQHNNAQNAVLFEAINLAIHLDPDSDVVKASSVLLSRFIMSKETNVRYLGLDTMAHLAARAESLDIIKHHQDTIILSLKDRDISVRRRGLDLLYSMCDVTNAKVIVGELLRYLQTSDYALREELVLKVAILTEKFATEYEWYVDTILRLMSMAGDHVGDEVWYRVVQIVTNTEELQEYASRKVFEHLHSMTVHENMVKVGAYILGEFGHLVANEPGLSPMEQFQVLQSKANLCSTPTRALLLTTYVKWLNLFPEIRSQLVEVLEKYTHVLDAELQQRACEYLALAQLPEEDLLQVVCDEMPPFPERESALQNRLHKSQGTSGDKRTWKIGGKDANREQLEERARAIRKKGKAPAEPEAGPSATNGHANGGPEEDLLGGVAGADVSAPSAAAASAGPVDAERPLISDAGATPGVGEVGPGFTHGSDRALTRMIYTTEGVLYEDAQLQIGIKTEYHGNFGRLALYFGNKIGQSFESFTLSVESENEEALGVTLPKMPTNTIAPFTQVQQIVQIECKDAFISAPVMQLSYLAGSLQTIRLPLPVYLSKFIEPVQLGAGDFFERWKQIGGPPREAQEIFGIKLDSSGAVDTARNQKVVAGCKFGVLNGVDPNPSNVVGAGVLHMSTAGKVGCLLRLEPNKDAKLARMTIRTTNDVVSAELLKLLVKPLRHGSK